MRLRNTAVRILAATVLAAVPATAIASDASGPVPVKAGTWHGTATQDGHLIFSASFKVSGKSVKGFEGSFGKHAPAACRPANGKLTVKAKSLKLTEHKGKTKSGVKYDYFGFGTQDAEGGLYPKPVKIERHGMTASVGLALQFTKVSPEGEISWGTGKDVCAGFFKLKHV